MLAYLHFLGIPIFPIKADPVLIVDANAVLTVSVALQFFQAISRGTPQIQQISCLIQHLQLALGRALGPAFRAFAVSPKLRGGSIGKGSNHTAS